jgi:Spy/CpxP family protein refolding chaperone
MPTHHKAAMAAALALTAGATLAAAPAFAAPPYLSMTSEIRGCAGHHQPQREHHRAQVLG